MTDILGISAYYHDSAAALIRDGRILAAAQEERFTRKKHDAGFPERAIRFCLSETGANNETVDKVVFYDKPLLKFERLLESYITFSPSGFRSFLTAMPVWMKEKLFLKTLLKRQLAPLLGVKTGQLPEILFTEHHHSHAASAFYPSPFADSAVLCMDGVGEWATTSVWCGEGRHLKPLWQIDFPHSLGLLYSAFTYFIGFKVNSGEYKLMGLAPYGRPVYRDRILNELVDVREDGTFRMNMAYFNYVTGLTMTGSRFNDLFDGPPRKPEQNITQREMNIAASIQSVTEDIVVRLARTVRRETGMVNLCLAGGVALNCVANGILLKENIFEGLWVQPAAGDAGGAIGAALAVWYEYYGNERHPESPDGMSGSFLGPGYASREIREYLDGISARYEELPDELLFARLAGLLADEKVIGWFQGRMEFGPRALGGRSIIGDPRSKTMQSVMNLKIKYRESFRPFAPSVLAGKVSDYFELDGDSPYMLLVAPVRQELRKNLTTDQEQLFGIERLNVPKSEIPAVTHVDYSARVQTVHENTNPRYHRLIEAFGRLTGCYVLVNTSFNVRGEPIVCSPEDAYRCFMRTEMDYLVLENILLAKADQPAVGTDDGWMQEFEPD